MSSPDDLRKQKEELQTKITQTEQMIGTGLSWKDAQFYLEKYKEEIRVIDNQIAKAQLGEDAVSELRNKKAQLQAKLQSIEQMKNDGTISDKVYKDKKKEIEKEIQQVEKDIVDAM
jgi:chromosome segregation ATPase